MANHKTFTKIAAELEQIQSELSRLAADTSPTKDGAEALFKRYKSKYPGTKKTVKDFYEPDKVKNVDSRGTSGAIEHNMQKLYNKLRDKGIDDKILDAIEDGQVSTDNSDRNSSRSTIKIKGIGKIIANSWTRESDSDLENPPPPATTILLQDEEGNELYRGTDFSYGETHSEVNYSKIHFILKKLSEKED
jgi:hypothetical protein